MGRYRSLLVALVGAAAMAVYSAVSDNHVTPDEAIQIGIAVVSAFIVWNTANTNLWPYAKAIAAAVLAILNAAAAAWTGGFTLAEVVNLIIQAGVAAGVLILPNAPSVTAVHRQIVP